MKKTLHSDWCIFVLISVYNVLFQFLFPVSVSFPFPVFPYALIVLSNLHWNVVLSGLLCMCKSLGLLRGNSFSDAPFGQSPLNRFHYWGIICWHITRTSNANAFKYYRKASTMHHGACKAKQHQQPLSHLLEGDSILTALHWSVQTSVHNSLHA